MDDVESIAEEILAYLRQRPLATDSLDGITHWWLVQQSLWKNRQLVEQALERLVEQGKLSKTSREGQQDSYSAGPQLNADEP